MAPPPGGSSANWAPAMEATVATAAVERIWRRVIIQAPLSMVDELEDNSALPGKPSRAKTGYQGHTHWPIEAFISGDGQSRLPTHESLAHRFRRARACDGL